MKPSLILEVLQAWRKLNLKEKIKLLQQFEECNAKLQKRESREIILSKSLDSSVQAQYKFDEPSYLFLSNTKSMKDALTMLENVYHEGFHAYVDDFFHDKTDLTLFSCVDKDKMFQERSYLQLIYNRAIQEGILTLFSLKYYEEKLVRKETCLFFLYNLLHVCENLEDVNGILELYHDKVMGSFYLHEKYAEEVDRISPMTYNQLFQMVLSIDSLMYQDKLLSVDTTKKIYDGVDKKLLQHFETNFDIFMKYQEEVNALKQQKLTQELIRNIIDYTKAK